MNETNETKAEILNRGFADEMTAAVEYLKIAGRYGDDMLKQQFLQYAGDELNHAAKILRLMQENDIKAETIDFSESDEGLREKMIEYIANEESAVFYYDILQKLHPDKEIVELCQGIKSEEELHLRNIKEIFKQTGAK